MHYGTEMNVTILGQKVTVQGHAGTMYARYSTLWACYHVVLKSINHIFTQNYTNDVSWNRDECFKFWGQKVTVQGHGGITYAGTTTVQAEAYSTRRWC